MTALYDPAAPPLIFDGNLAVYSTCRDCGELMKVITADQHSHPTCTIVQTQLESLADLWLAEVNAGNHEQADQTVELIHNVENLVDFQSAALEYASWDWPVFPLGRRAKEPAIPKAKGGNGFKDAHTDEARITRYWRKHPDHNVGLATGHMFDVIDIDTKNGNEGVTSLMKAIELKDIPECHGIAVTPSGGMHLYVKPTGKGNYASIRPGIDYRGKGGYVVAPPSVIRAANRYTWLVEPSTAIKGGF
jgi:hypothetical protein